MSISQPLFLSNYPGLQICSADFLIGIGYSYFLDLREIVELEFEDQPQKM